MTQKWTYETLAQADKATLENILRTGTPPDLEELNGYIYCGWNHEWIGRLSGIKFKKGFYKKDGLNYGFNETVVQDHQGFLGQWESGLHKVRPNQLGYFKTAYARDQPVTKLSTPYLHLATFDYTVPFHKWYLIFFSVIKDFVVCPNEGDNSLMLCKAYLHFSDSFNVFYCYFILGHRYKIRYLPW
ncbi:hypothetical protein Q4E93_23850 [Flavitalea sp. BT771]|uniref:hypothetical protein n=1 Tax=Flavitalea sp. BT771 TaxID=3063329 RepID=UPI0026E367BB|nr:hypothetical protein [Flavitalea sp. BT771]MDO6433666.1 hypothetical protein [Flavitalea sp. BT771]MDV6222429.1 hypothetical protein [Flavitalea sp. BT771]